MGQLLDILAADAAGQHAKAEAAFQALRTGQTAHPRLQAERALLHTAAQAMNAALRPCFDADYGSYTAHPMDPRNDDDDSLTPDQAHDEAAEQVLSYAESVADWLAKACDTDAGRMPLDVRALEPLQIIEGSPALLLSVLMNGDNSQVLRAVHGLREMAGKHFAAEINERSAQLLAEAA
jgi:hypothetical protein